MKIGLLDENSCTYRLLRRRESKSILESPPGVAGFTRANTSGCDQSGRSGMQGREGEKR